MVRRTLIALAAVWMLGGMAKAETPTPALPSRSTASCVVAEDDETLPIGVVMRLITRCRAELGLSDAQRARLDRVRFGLLEETLRLEARREEAEDALAGLLRPDPEDPARPVDLGAAEARIREIERIVSEQEIATLRAVEASKAVLTPAQGVTLAALLVDVLGPRRLGHRDRT
jgi:hypothetical protein